MSRSIFLSQKRRPCEVELLDAQRCGVIVSQMLGEEDAERLVFTSGDQDAFEMILHQLAHEVESEAGLYAVASYLGRVSISDPVLLQRLFDRLNAAWRLGSAGFEEVSGRLSEQLSALHSTGRRAEFDYRVVADEDSIGYTLFLKTLVPFAGEDLRVQLRDAALRLCGQAFSPLLRVVNSRKMTAAAYLLHDFFATYPEYLDLEVGEWLMGHLKVPRASPSCHLLSHVVCQILALVQDDPRESIEQFILRYREFVETVVFGSKRNGLRLGFKYLSIMNDPTLTRRYLSGVNGAQLQHKNKLIVWQLIQSVHWKPQDADFLLPIIGYLDQNLDGLEWLRLCGVLS